MKINSLVIYATAAVLFISTGCKKDSNTSQPATENTSTVKVNFSSTSAFTFFSFKNNAVVPNTDSVSSNWDFGIRLTTFLVNSHASGPGNAGVIMQDGIFDNVLTAPVSGYAYDTASNKLAIKDGTWYDYNTATRSFVPKAGKVFIFRTADNRYAKMEILEATYDPFVGQVPDKINYKLRFIYQADGSVNLQKQ